MAKAEQRYGHRGSYYVQAYLLRDEKNIELLKKMQSMGHEISYHYDVLDSCKGDFEKAFLTFEANKQLFEKSGFTLKTVCQHGNPIVERVGYTSNRDFFRSEKIQLRYPEIADIMVDFKTKYLTDYGYISDAGRQFKLIFDPINNDIVNSDDKNIAFENLDKVFKAVSSSNESYIISTHPHRWQRSAIIYSLKHIFFRVIKLIAKTLARIPIVKKIMSKYYYLAKNI
ncbi:MAG: hypothetical protein IJ391_09770 [Clostridia bacterium]|nr:hypothetical protein [Clostridia bacterium]